MKQSLDTKVPKECYWPMSLTVHIINKRLSLATELPIFQLSFAIPLPKSLSFLYGLVK